jgi:signal transduction histidine kinase
VQLNDSIFNEQKEKIFDELQTKYQTERQAQQIDLLKKENENKKIQTTLFIFGSIILILFVFVLIFFMLRIHKNNRLLHLKNLEVTQAKEEVKQINEEIKQINEHLEDLVETRTEELKHSVNNLLKQNQDLEQFSFIISHNIRSPIARILGLVNVFNVENMDDPFNLQILGHLEQAGENLDMVIKDLNKIVSVRKSLDVNKEEVNFESELNITLEHLTEQISKSNTKIDFVFNIACIHSIKGYVQSILYNLISNAIKYKAKNRSPVIHIKTEIVDKYVCLSIQDNGLGIDLANTDTYKIFGLYQRMHSHVQGKGMGLFLVKTQIESLGGKIEVKSELNAGTTFYVYFPN